MSNDAPTTGSLADREVRTGKWSHDAHGRTSARTLHAGRCRDPPPYFTLAHTRRFMPEQEAIDTDRLLAVIDGAASGQIRA